MDSGENQPNDALSLDAVTLGLARIALIVRSRSPVLATIHGAARMRATSRIAKMPRIRSIRNRRRFGELAGACSLMVLTPGWCLNRRLSPSARAAWDAIEFRDLVSRAHR